MLDYATVLGRTYGYRLLTRRELREAQNLARGNELQFEDEVCRTCVQDLPPGFPGWNDVPAGVPTELCRKVMDSSGYSGPTKDPKTGRPIPSPMEQRAMAWAKTPEARMDSLICFCFPGKDIDALDDLDPWKYYQLAAAANLIVGGIYGMDVSAFLDPSKDGKPGPQGPGPQRPPGGGQAAPQYLINTPP